MTMLAFEKFNENKAINALLFITKNLKRKDFHKIFKIFYFSDRNHLSKFGRSITGDTYIAMEDGPVPSNIYDILKSVRGDGYFIDKDNFSKYFKIDKWDLVIPIIDPNLKVLSISDIEAIKASLDKYGDLSWDEVREKSHDYAWRSTSLNRPISIDDLILETGQDEEFVEYVKENILLQNSLA